MDCLREVGDDLLVNIEVSPASGKFGIPSYNEWRKRIEVKIRSPTQKGEANREIIREFSETFGRDVEIVSGQKSRQKTIRIQGMGRDLFLKMISEKFGLEIP